MIDRRTWARRKAIAAVIVGGVLLAIGACQDPTQVTLDITYGGSCADLQGSGIAVVVGNEPRETEARVQSDFFTSTTTACEAGRIGTLVMTPSDSSERGVVIVIAGLGRPPQECDPANGYFGCVVARRAFSFVEHTRLVVPIVLDPNCKNVPCDAVSTCKSGACVSSETKCDGERCDAFGLEIDGGPAFVDAPVSSDQSAPPPEAGPRDARVDAPAPGSCAKEPMTCPIGGPRCSSADACCTRPPTGAPGARARSCDPGLGACGDIYMDFSAGLGAHLACRGARNCPDPSHWCCAPPAPVTTCASDCSYMGPGNPPSIVCQLDCECPSDMFCDTSTPYFTELFKCKPR